MVITERQSTTANRVRAISYGRVDACGRVEHLHFDQLIPKLDGPLNHRRIQVHANVSQAQVSNEY
jgi:hypothetical protein